MSTQTKIIYSLVIIATTVSLATGGFFLADRLSAGTASLANNPSPQVATPTTEVAAGTPGAPGREGLTGEAGLTGKAGVKGTSGTPGTAGANGLPGLAGSSGATGETGAAGANGLSGVDGANGSNGAAGANGPAGTNGIMGPNGAAGTQGAAGAQGDAGEVGPQGPPGSSGRPLITGIPEKLELDLKTQVFGLTGGQYVLADGVEGQQVYFFAADGATLENITILVSDLREAGGKGSVTIFKEGIWAPFSAQVPVVNMVSAIFAQGAWTFTGGAVLG